MAYEQKELTGSTFKNDKQGNESRPDTTGSCLIEGVKYYMSGWLNNAGTDKQFISWKFKRTDEAQKKTTPINLEDGIPF